MVARGESPNVGEIQILSDEEPTSLLGDPPDLLVGTTFEPLSQDRVNSVTKPREILGQARRHILIELDLHADRLGMPGVGRSS